MQYCSVVHEVRYVRCGTRIIPTDTFSSMHHISIDPHTHTQPPSQYPGASLMK